MTTPRGSPAPSIHVLGDHIQPGALLVAVEGCVSPDSIPLLCGRIQDLIRSSRAVLVVCDVGSLADPSAAAVDMLARLRLMARRLGLELLLVNAHDDLDELIGLMGLRDVLGCGGGLGVQVRGQPEEREEPLGVEEETDPGDLAGGDVEDL